MLINIEPMVILMLSFVINIDPMVILMMQNAKKMKNNMIKK